MEIGKINLEWLGHAGFLIKNSRVIYIDPYNIKDGLPKADIVLITHSHYDHCSMEDLQKIVQDGTRIFIPADCQSKIVRFDLDIRMTILEPGQEINLNEVRICAFPAYNLDKSFHPKQEAWIGYLIKMDDLIIYHAGDTDKIEEMQKLTGYKQPGKEFIALLPVGGRFTMNAEEAAEAAKVIKPTIAIPMHYGSIVGSKEDAEEFKDICKESGINVNVLEKIK